MRLFKSFLFQRFWRWRLLKKRVFWLFVLAFASLFTTNKVFADSFYPSADTKFCEFAQAAAISYSSLTTNGVSSGLTYDLSKVKGVTLNNIKSMDFEDIGDVTYPDARRKNGLASSVSVPPNTLVDLDVFYYNFSGHSITVDEGIFYTSMPNPTSGDLTKLGAPGVNQTNTFIYNGNNVTRTGKAFSTKPWKTIPPHAYASLPKGERFTTFAVIQPVKINERSITPEFRDGSLYLKYRTEIQNVSQYALNNVQIEDTFLNGTKHNESVNLTPGSKKVFTYEDCLCYGYTYELHLPRLKVIDPNKHIENAGSGTTDLFSYSPETRVFYTKRNDLGAPSSWLGVQGDFTAVGSGDFISIEQIPYELHTDFKHITLKPNVKPLPVLRDNDETGSSNTLELGETMEVVSEITNSGAYMDNVKVFVDYNKDHFEYIGSTATRIDEDTLSFAYDRVGNSEIMRESFEFEALDNVTPGIYNDKFTFRVTGATNYTYLNNLTTKLIIPEAVSPTTKEINYKIPISQTSYFPGSNQIITKQVLAKTGQFNFYLPASLIIIALWFLQNWLKKYNMLKKVVKLKLLYLHMSPI